MSTQTIEEVREQLKQAEANEDQALIFVLRQKLSTLADEAEPPVKKRAARAKKA